MWVAPGSTGDHSVPGLHNIEFHWRSAIKTQKEWPMTPLNSTNFIGVGVKPRRLVQGSITTYCFRTLAGATKKKRLFLRRRSSLQVIN